MNGQPSRLDILQQISRATDSEAVSPGEAVENGPHRLSALPDPCSSSELAAVLGKSPKTIVDWCQERAYTHIPCFRLGNRWYHRPTELMRWLNGIKSGHVEFRRKPRNSAERK